MNRNRHLNLQLFNNTNVTTDTGMSVEMKTFYDKVLIKLAKPNLVHDQFGQKKPIPKGSGKTIEFRKYDPLPKALTPLTEGVTPNGKKLSVTDITSTVNQYGDYVELSDMLIMTAIDNNVVEATEQIGDQAGRTLDTITRDVLAAGTNVIYAGGKTSRANLAATDTLKPIYFERAATQLKAANTPTINGSYVAIIHPYASFDLRTSSEWIEVHKYADATPIFEGEIGKLGNVRFVESTEAKIWKDNTCPVITPAAGTVPGTYKAVFSTLVLGANAYGVTDIEGGGLQTIIKQLGAGDDPLNQRATVGWKATKTAEILVEPYMVRIESLSDYSEVAEAN